MLKIGISMSWWVSFKGFVDFEVKTYTRLSKSLLDFGSVLHNCVSNAIWKYNLLLSLLLKFAQIIRHQFIHIATYMQYCVPSKTVPYFIAQSAGLSIYFYYTTRLCAARDAPAISHCKIRRFDVRYYHKISNNSI